MTTAIEITCPHCLNNFSIYTYKSLRGVALNTKDELVDLNRTVAYHRFDEAPLSAFSSLINQPLQCPSCKQICTIKVTVWVE